MGCENCNPIIMTRQGCCTGATGRAEGLGVTHFEVKKTGIVYEMCGALKKDEKGFYCGIYYDGRPEVCEVFECPRTIKDRIDGR